MGHCELSHHTNIHYEKDVRVGIPSFDKKRSEPSFQGNEDAKSVERNCQVCYGSSLEYGNEQSFSFTDTRTKGNKTINRLQKETL